MKEAARQALAKGECEYTTPLIQTFVILSPLKILTSTASPTCLLNGHLHVRQTHLYDLSTTPTGSMTRTTSCVPLIRHSLPTFAAA